MSRHPETAQLNLSAAAMLSVGSSRITVCGQAPASTARHAVGVDEAGAPDALGVLGCHEVVGDDGQFDRRVPRAGIRASIERRLAGANGTADADPGADSCLARGPVSMSQHAFMASSSQHVALAKGQLPGGFAGGQLAVDEDVEGLRIDA